RLRLTAVRPWWRRCHSECHPNQPAGVPDQDGQTCLGVLEAAEKWIALQPPITRPATNPLPIWTQLLRNSRVNSLQGRPATNFLPIWTQLLRNSRVNSLQGRPAMNFWRNLDRDGFGRTVFFSLGLNRPGPRT